MRILLAIAFAASMVVAAGCCGTGTCAPAPAPAPAPVVCNPCAGL